jgi:hypothetical protein
MKSIKYAVFGLAFASSASFAGDCQAPDMPELPDGASATMEQMLAGQKAVKAFQAANMDYMGCVEDALTAAESAMEDASGDAKDAATDAYQAALDTYNAAVSAEEEVAGQFNTEIREYKANQ